MLNNAIKFFLEQKLITVILLLGLVVWGLMHAPFRWEIGFLPRDPVAVDAIPDIGENQQIIYTEWMGRSPKDVEDQITYPITTSLLGMPGVKSIRSTSMFGISSIYIIFEDDTEYYWSRARILEKLSSMPRNFLPEGVQPQLGPDATALGQVFWYTLEGRTSDGKPVGGWDLHTLRSINDYFIKYALSSVKGVSEVASIGGYIKEYQIDLHPDIMRQYGIGMMEVMEAVRQTNADIGANTMEVNQVEYYIRGLGYVQGVEDIEETVLKTTRNIPIKIKDIAHVQIGPADRSMLGILDKGGAEATGGVVISRYGENPMEVIELIKAKIEEISPGLPEIALEDGTVSKVTIVPFYDRTGLILETLATLNDAIFLQVLVTMIVIIVLVYNLRASILIAGLLPLAVLICFIFMKYFGIDANIVALSGIAIAIGTMVDLGIIMNENILKHINEKADNENLMMVIFRAVKEVSSAIVTALATTVVSFLPVFTLEAAEGKLFGPLAWTKTFALIAALIFTLFIMPAFSHWVFGWKVSNEKIKRILNYVLLILSIVVLFYFPEPALVLFAVSINNLLADKFEGYRRFHLHILVAITVLALTIVLAQTWLPLGAEVSMLTNVFFVSLLIGIVLGVFYVFMQVYGRLLAWFLEHKVVFLILPISLLFLSANIWLGFDSIMGWTNTAANQLGWDFRTSNWYRTLHHSFPGMGKEFMPALDEGSFLLMPTSMPHSGVEANLQILQKMDIMVQQIPEVELVVGKAGRAETALDPAPMSMYENVIQYKSEYLQDEYGRKIRFKVDKENNFIKDEQGNLIPDKKGRYFRQWRDHIKSSNDIWQEISQAVDLPGVTSAPKLQPIETRLVMLQTGMRAPMGIKVFGPDLQTIEETSLKIESLLKEVPSVKKEAVFADRSLGKPYLEIAIDRKKIAQHGLTIGAVQEVIEVALGGMELSTTIEGRERYSIRARYAREFRDDPYKVDDLLVPSYTGKHIPLSEIAEIKFSPGPMMIRSEDSFLVGYVLFDKKDGFAEVTVVDQAKAYLEDKIRTGELNIPAGLTFRFSGSYENQVRAEKRLKLVIPLSLIVIFLILYLQFRKISTTFFIFSSILLAFSGGFLMLWLYGQSWFFDFDFLGTSLRDLFQMKNYNLSVAVWVGFIALFGIATDDGVVMATYLKQSFENKSTKTIEEIRNAVVAAGMRRVRPCLMTTATTILALLPVLTSTGKGSDIMVPMAIPAFGGMSVALITLFFVPILYSWSEEFRFYKSLKQSNMQQNEK